MHKTITRSIIVILFAVTALSSCSDSDYMETDTDIKLVPVSEALSEHSFEIAVNGVSAGNYDNLVLGEIKYDVFPCKDLDIIKWPEDNDISPSEEALKKLYAHLTGCEISEDMIGFSSFDDITECQCDTSNTDGTHKLNFHRKQLEENEITASDLVLIDNDHSILIDFPTNQTGGVLLNVKGQAASMIPEELPFSYWMPGLDEYTVPKERLDLISDADKSIAFIGGNVKFKEALSEMQKELEAICSSLSDNFGLTVDTAQIAEYNNSEILSFNLTVCYNDIDIESVPSGTVTQKQFIEESKKLGYALEPTAVSVSNGELCFYVGDIPRAKVETVGKLEKIISPDKVLSLLSEKLTGQTKFKLDELSLCYLNSTDRSTPSNPYWKVYLENTTDKSQLRAFVDCQSGEIYISKVDYFFNGDIH